MSSSPKSVRSSLRPHSSYSEVAFKEISSGGGVSIQCQFCPAQDFRRSRLRGDDFKQLLLMRYPVRCLRCGQRQSVSFTIASISVPSHIRQRRARRGLEVHKHWSEPRNQAAAPAPGGPAPSEPDKSATFASSSGPRHNV